MNPSLLATMDSFQGIYATLKKDIEEHEGRIKGGRWSRSMGINWALFTLLLDGALKRMQVPSKSGISDVPPGSELKDREIRKKVVVEIGSMLEAYLRNTDKENEYSVVIAMKEKKPDNDTK